MASFFVGTNISVLSKNHTFVGFKFRGHCICLHIIIPKIPFSWILDFVDQTFHENWYPMNIKTSTVHVICVSERIHQAHGAAQKAKKSLQKPKSGKVGSKFLCGNSQPHLNTNYIYPS